jgi:hypothetical protein
MDADAKYLLQCTLPSCQKLLPYKWGIAQGFRAHTGEWYCVLRPGFETRG